MFADPRIEMSASRTFVGTRISMSLAQNRTRELWQRFAPRIHEIRGRTGNELVSIDVQPEGYFSAFDPNRQFEKWAAVEVLAGSSAPENLEMLTVPAGLHAIFLHRGPASLGPRTYHHILTVWLPSSGYRLDERPHLAIMGDRYRNDDPDSEEELWIPICSTAAIEQ